jgi:hypothetical protein
LTGHHKLFTRIHITVHLYVRTHRRPLIHDRPAWAPNGPRIGGQACTGSAFVGPHDKLGNSWSDTGYHAAPDRQLRSELADVLEVLRALAAAHGVSWEDVVAEAARKRDERGGFDQRIFLEYVDQVG